MNINFEKGEGLIPVIIQDFTTLEVLMLGYMNEEAYQKTIEENRVTFFSRSKNRLWTKGESSGNYLMVNKIHLDCDQDTLLIFATPNGPTCHTGSKNCFNLTNDKSFLFELENIINSRYNHPNQDSYVNKLREKGLNKIAQKVGEEGVETVIAALAESREHLINESSDLLFHLLVLLKEKGISLEEIGLNLKNRHVQAN
ncbi:bifunctional phosphoribosyl-AMP cyclohydrolase/phosphoribosyl-ATP diphosphatase HisIE [Pedobacter flavus]|uniref:Histidine biosynthesis bifunctional protein HisIE n=1 Tax=Pedobacter flavus TaxID=3113906 RepID=A0ABU7H3P6_9SPHI|nr:bifunctional phosphoribosyl-AMP cyclohydrolase/phosphoribosyl-ATP diphosphatase HisIE [Pedobacter sp. VNH31]MEE1885950.1 bifunctional phosphoribosyl-AMP cyclohydrolase/phosphoribosyl-ATP diphosphatase HisIE [Pedobacter sp. VNH31]